MNTDEKMLILLVEDDPNDEELTRMALEENKIANEIVIARDGVEAIDFFCGKGIFEGRDVSVLPQVVLLDLKLPKLNGLDVLKHLRQDPRTRSLPVVIFTSSKEEKDLIKSYELGANSFIQKPIDFVQFSSAVKELGVYWVIWNRRPKKMTTAQDSATEESARE